MNKEETLRKYQRKVDKVEVYPKLLFWGKQ